MAFLILLLQLRGNYTFGGLDLCFPADFDLSEKMD